MSYLSDEIASQPACWSQAIEMAASAALALPRPGERVAAIGCGSSLNVARCYAALREAAGQGETDAFPASEVAGTRQYDRLVYISRTGTTTEVLQALRRAPREVSTVAVTADPHAPLARAADRAVLLHFADERSVVSSRPPQPPGPCCSLSRARVLWSRAGSSQARSCCSAPTSARTSATCPARPPAS